MIYLERENLRYESFAKDITLPLKPFSNKYIGNSLFKIAKSTIEFSNFCKKYDEDGLSLYRIVNISVNKGVKNDYIRIFKENDIVNGRMVKDLSLKEPVKILSDMDYRCIEHFSRSAEDFERKCTELFLTRFLTLLGVSTESVSMEEFVENRHSVIYGILTLVNRNIDTIVSMSNEIGVNVILNEIIHGATDIMMTELRKRIGVKVTSGEIFYNDKLVSLLLDYIVKTNVVLTNTMPYNVTLRNLKKFLLKFGFEVNNNLILHSSGSVDTLSLDNILKLINVYVICSTVSEVERELKEGVKSDNNMSIYKFYNLCNRIFELREIGYSY